MVMERCSPQMEGDRLCQKLTVTQSLINTMYNSRRLLKYMHTIYNTCMPCAALDKIMVKIYNNTEN